MLNWMALLSARLINSTFPVVFVVSRIGGVAPGACPRMRTPQGSNVTRPVVTERCAVVPALSSTTNSKDPPPPDHVRTPCPPPKEEEEDNIYIQNQQLRKVDWNSIDFFYPTESTAINRVEFVEWCELEEWRWKGPDWLLDGSIQCADAGADVATSKAARYSNVASLTSRLRSTFTIGMSLHLSTLTAARLRPRHRCAVNSLNWSGCVMLVNICT